MIYWDHKNVETFYFLLDVNVTFIYDLFANNVGQEAVMNLTEKERAMLKKFEMASDDGKFCYTCFLCDSRSDNAVVGSLIKKGVFISNGLNDMDSGVELSDNYR